MQGLTGRSEPQRDSHTNPEHINDNSCHNNNNNDGYQDKNNDDDDHVTGHTSKNNITSHNETFESKATYAAGSRNSDAPAGSRNSDAPIALVVPRIWLFAMTGTRQQVQHLHEIATRKSRQAVQKTILKIKRSGTILRRKQRPHRPQRRTTAASTPIACNTHKDGLKLNGTCTQKTTRQRQHQQQQ